MAFPRALVPPPSLFFASGLVLLLCKERGGPGHVCLEFFFRGSTPPWFFSESDLLLALAVWSGSINLSLFRYGGR